MRVGGTVGYRREQLVADRVQILAHGPMKWKICLCLVSCIGLFCLVVPRPDNANEIYHLAGMPTHPMILHPSLSVMFVHASFH